MSSRRRSKAGKWQGEHEFAAGAPVRGRVDRGDRPVAAWKWPIGSRAVCYPADPGNTASILVFSVAALNGLTM